MKIVVGSLNKAKIRAAQLAVDKVFPGEKVTAIEVPSGVSNQPKTEKETMKGALNRAKNALKKTKADIAIGMEGGFSKIGKKWFECGWIAVVDKEGKIGLGSSARYELSSKIINELLIGKELKDVMNRLTKRNDIHYTQGAMGVLTDGHLQRDEAYMHGILFAFAPFLSDSKFWD